MKAATLLAIWRSRDNRYAIRKVPLSEAELEAAIAWRRREADDLEADERTRCLTALALWMPRTDVR